MLGIILRGYEISYMTVALLICIIFQAISLLGQRFSQGLGQH